MAGDLTFLARIGTTTDGGKLVLRQLAGLIDGKRGAQEALGDIAIVHVDEPVQQGRNKA